MRTPGVVHAIGFPGLSANGFANLDKSALMFFPLDDFAERTRADLSATAIAAHSRASSRRIADAQILVVPPPPVQGLGTTGGFKLYVQDRAGHGYDALAAVVDEVLAAARQQPELLAPATYTSFQNSVPQLFADVDRIKAKRQGLAISDVFGTLQAYLGSTYVNDFNRFGRTFRVYAQADAHFRANPKDVAGLKTRNAGAIWCRSAPSRTSADRRGRIVCRTTTSISRPTSTARRRPAFRRDRRSRRWSACSPDAADRLRLRVD